MGGQKDRLPSVRAGTAGGNGVRTWAGNSSPSPVISCRRPGEEEQRLGLGRASRTAPGSRNSVCPTAAAHGAGGQGLRARRSLGQLSEPRTSPPQGWGSPRAPPPLRTRPAFCSLSHRAPPAPSPGSPLLPPPPGGGCLYLDRRSWQGPLLTLKVEDQGTEPPEALPEKYHKHSDAMGSHCSALPPSRSITENPHLGPASHASAPHTWRVPPSGMFIRPPHCSWFEQMTQDGMGREFHLTLVTQPSGAPSY